MNNADFRVLWEKAQNGDKEALEKLFIIFNPVLKKNSVIDGKFNEDCFQELTIKLINGIQAFAFSEQSDILKYLEPDT